MDLYECDRGSVCVLSQIYLRAITACHAAMREYHHVSVWVLSRSYLCVRVPCSVLRKDKAAEACSTSESAEGHEHAVPQLSVHAEQLQGTEACVCA